MKINKLAIPLLLNSISSTIINLCDQAMVGRTYLEGFASVAIIGSNIYSITNVLFDYILIFGKFGFPQLGIVGNALGSVLSLILGIVFYIIIIKKYKLISKTKISLLKNAEEILKVSTPMILQEFVESTIVVFMMNYILSQIGMLEVSIYNLLFSIINIALMPMYAYSHASLNIISEDIGAKNTIEINKTIKSCVFRAIGLYSVICIVILIFKNQIPMIITNNADLITNSSKYMLIIITANIMNIPSCILKFSMQALGEEKVVFVCSSAISILSTFLIYILVCMLNGGLNSVYIGLMINYSILTVVLLKKFYVTKKSFIVK